MSRPIISIESLSKRYLLGHRHAQAERYTALRDVLARSAKGILRTTCDFLAGRQLIQGDEVEEFWALKDVSFEVQTGEVIGIIGRNGAGKSTLLKVLSRITEPTEGRVTLRGRVASLLEVGTGFHPELTGRENIFLNGAILGMSRAEVRRKFDEIVAFAEVENFLDTPVKRYSSGMYVRLAFSVAAHLEPEILIVDEVLAVGDAQFQKKCLGKMGDVAKGGRTVLFVSHNLAAIQALCHSGVLLEKGRLRAAGNLSDVLAEYRERSADASQETSAEFPVFNRTHGVGIRNCAVRIPQSAAGHRDLEITLELISDRRLRGIGVGFSLKTIDGLNVCHLGAMVTNHFVDELDGECTCTLRCAEVDRYLSGGEYKLSVWLAWPRVESLVRLDDVGIVDLEPRDVYRSGVFLESRRHGPVPLPVSFHVDAGPRAGDSETVAASDSGARPKSPATPIGGHS